MKIDEFDEIFNDVLQEVNSEPYEVFMERFAPTPQKISIEEAIAQAIVESRNYTQKLLYRLLAELFVDDE